MKLRKIVLLQDTKEQNEILAETFTKTEEYEVVAKSLNGEEVCDLVNEYCPDFLITELVLKGYDGLKVVEEVAKMKKGVKIIVLSALCSAEIIERALRLGADYFMAKPYNFNLLEERMSELLESEKEQVKPEGYVKRKSVSLEEKISKIFINVGIPPHIKGYSFLREGVVMAVKEPEIINNITKKLYPMIGKRYNTTASKVERAIRHAIEVAWNRGRIESINAILGVRAYVGGEKPTNGEFIALVADKMLLENS
ncbi:MAG: sporulation transcription factor Spo0A [Clostridia bacterium]|nr:sporulation transcription factor Spo0A [Clostridia bacterium]